MLANPAPGRPVTSQFGWRVHPITGNRALHRGIDYGGTFPVLVAASGKVVKNGAALGPTGFGYYVVIEHSRILRTLYAHGAHRSPLRVGGQVRQGVTVFTSGMTGAATGPHLHFEVHAPNQFRLWTAVDPNPFFTVLAGDGLPVKVRPEEDDMKLIKRGSGSPEWSLFHPSLCGSDDLQRGYIVTTSFEVARGWARTWGDGFGREKVEPRDVYVELQAAARVTFDAYVRGLTARVEVGGFPGVSVVPVPDGAVQLGEGLRSDG